MPENGQLITLERLFQNAFGESLYESIFRITDRTDRLRYLAGQVETLLAKEPYYPEEIKDRVKRIVFDRMQKYRYLFR